VIPEDLYKRRRNHNNTPKSVLLIFANYVTILVSASLFTSCNGIHWFFWLILAGLAVYNYFNIRRFRDEYNKATIIAYILSLVFLIILFILFRLKGQGC
jgi:succinate dehydrogenase/fumarate reductase cytochrome b subunit